MSERFRCPNCGDEIRLTAVELQTIGDPHCGPCDSEPFSPHEMVRA